MKSAAKLLVPLLVVFGLLLASALGIGACAVTHLRVHGAGWHSGVESSRSETHELTFDPAQPFVAEVDSGRIQVRESADGKASLVAHLRAYDSEKADADQRLAAMRLDLHPNAVRVEDQRKSGLRLFESGGESVDLELSLPPGARLVLHSGSGDVEVEGAFGDTQADSGYGQVKAGRIRGRLAAKSGSGDVYASAIQGPEIQLESGYGNLQLRDLAGESISAHTGSGDVLAERIDAQRARLESGYGEVRVRGMKGSLDAKSGSGDVEIVEISGALRASSGYGDVEAEGRFRGLALTSGSGSVKAQAAPGSELVDGWELRSDYGDVLLVLPAGLGFELDATTGYGEVRAQLPGVIGGVKGDEAHKLRGPVGGGGPRLKLHSGSGDVEIRCPH